MSDGVRQGDLCEREKLKMEEAEEVGKSAKKRKMRGKEDRERPKKGFPILFSISKRPKSVLVLAFRSQKDRNRCLLTFFSASEQDKAGHSVEIECHSFDEVL